MSEELDKIIVGAAVGEKRIPWPLKLFGIVCIVLGSLAIPVIGLAIYVLVVFFRDGGFAEETVTSVVLFFTGITLLLVFAVLAVLLGIRLVRNRRRHAAHLVEALVIITVAILLIDMMVFGLQLDDIAFLVVLGILGALSAYLDPSLSDERKLQRKLRNMENRSIAEQGDNAGRDPSGKGFLTLNFFNLFWIFFVCCILGLLIETVYCFVRWDMIQDRAGMLFGPFSPIYGFGALLMTVALNRFYDKPLVVIFLVSAVIGGVFEYAVSWFLQFAFGITAWDYTGSWLSIDGRTNGFYMIAWGILGLVWIKLLLPQLLKLVNKMPWNLRYSVTVVFAVLMLVNGAMTLMSFDFWFERISGKEPETPIELFFDERFSDDYMQNRFQTMSIDPENATRVKK